MSTLEEKAQHVADALNKDPAAKDRLKIWGHSLCTYGCFGADKLQWSALGDDRAD